MVLKIQNETHLEDLIEKSSVHHNEKQLANLCELCGLIVKKLTTHCIFSLFQAI